VNNLVFVFAAVAIGSVVSLQPPINATMARAFGSPLFAALISLSISVIVAGTLWLSWGRGHTEVSNFRTLPWWVMFGGVIGVIFVAGSISLIPILGVALFFVCVIAGQLLGSTLVDHFGGFGVAVQPVNTMKIVGLGLVIVGATLVQMSRS
jgi:transporter family-2 protein